MGKLTGKVAVVTGASKGIGAAIAKELAGQGASVAVNYASSAEGANKVVAAITAAGGKAIAVQANLAEPTSATALIAATVKAFGPIDVLVNNAGVYEFGALETVTPEHFHKQFDLNVLGLLLTTQAAVAEFNAKGGSVINISSVAARGVPGGAVYSATKGAVDTITAALAEELGGKKIRVNSLSPGLVETEGTQTAGIIGSPFEAQQLAKTPLGRIGQPEDIASAVAFLASDDSGWVTGQVIQASGGARL